MQRNKNNKNTLNQWLLNNNNNKKDRKNENSVTVNSNKVKNCNFCNNDKGNNADCCDKILKKKRNLTNFVCNNENVTNLNCKNENVRKSIYETENQG